MQRTAGGSMPKKKAGPEKGKKISRRVNMSHPSAPGSSLRRRAEDKLESEIRKPQSEDLHKLSKEEIQKLVHELRTHQIELEMQNEDLRKAQEEIKVSQQRYSDFYDFAPVGFFTFDKNGLILEVNLPGALMLNVDRRSLIKKPFQLFVDKEDRDIFHTYLREVLTNQEMQSCEIRLKIKSRTIHTQLQTIAAEGSEDGTDIYKTVISDITERKLLEAERNRLHKELERSNAELEHFAGIASHDLQEPLRMVKSYVQLLSDRYKDKLDRDAGEFMDYALKGAVHMQALISDLLAYSRVGSRSEPFALTDLNAPLKRALSYLRQLIDDSSAEIIFEDLPSAYADETQMVQLFQNLIGNAIKFRGSGPLRVHISSDLRGNEWTIRVSDNGIGIDPKHHDRVFEVFRRLHSTDKYPGTGIGLAVCRKIVERHGGRIWVESELGKETTFYFTLPDKK